jgi:hypothetical protein
MRENLAQRRGWTRFHAIFDRFVPNFGPIQATNPALLDENQSQQQPGVVQNGGVNFQVPQAVPLAVLNRLDAPAGVAISYRSLTYYYTFEAILFFAALYFGIKLNRAPREAKFAYVFFVGIGALIIAGVVDPRGAGKWDAIYIGVFLSLLFWLGWGTLLKLIQWSKLGIKAWREYERKPSATPPSPPPVPPVTATEPPASI